MKPNPIDWPDDRPAPACFRPDACHGADYCPRGCDGEPDDAAVLDRVEVWV